MNSEYVEGNTEGNKASASQLIHTSLVDSTAIAMTTITTGASTIANHYLPRRLFPNISS